MLYRAYDHRTARKNIDTFPLSICTCYLQFSSLKYQVCVTGFFVYFKLEFTGYSRQKNPVQTRKKFQFILLDISNWKIVEIKCRWIGCLQISSFRNLSNFTFSYLGLFVVLQLYNTIETKVDVLGLWSHRKKCSNWGCKNSRKIVATLTRP